MVSIRLELSSDEKYNTSFAFIHQPYWVILDGRRNCVERSNILRYSIYLPIFKPNYELVQDQE